MVDPSAYAKSRTGGSRLSPYEHLSRPERTRRSSKPFTSSTGRATPPSSDISSSLVPPANIINATPRPKSPRDPRTLRPNYSSARLKSVMGLEERQNTMKTSNLRTEYFRSKSAPIKRRSNTPVKPLVQGQPILAAQHFQSAVIQEPHVAPKTATSQKKNERSSVTPPRKHEWKSTDVTISGDSTTSVTTTTPSTQSSPSSRPQHTRNQSRRSQSPTPRSRRRPRENSSSGADHISFIRGCIQGGLYGGALVGSKVTECIYLSADVYQQECGPHQDRGDDRMFLFRRQRSYDDGDDILEDDPSSFYSVDRSKDTGDTHGSSSRRSMRTPTPTNNRKSVTPSPETIGELSSTHSRSNRRRDEREEKEEKEEDADRTPTRRTYNRHQDSFDVAPHAIRYDQGEMIGLHAARTKTPWEQSLPDATNEFVELRNVRLSMFQHDCSSLPHKSTHPTKETIVPPGSQQQISTQQSCLPRHSDNGGQEQPSSRVSDDAQTHSQSSLASPPAVSRIKQTQTSLESPPAVARIKQAGQEENSWADSDCGIPAPSFPPWRRAPPITGAPAPGLPPPELPPPALPAVDEEMKKELEETRKSLAKAREELQHAQEFVLKQQAATQTRTTQLTSEKIAIESKLKEEERAKEALLQRIGKLQAETTELKASLQQVQRDASQRSPSRKPPRTPPHGSHHSSPSRSSTSAAKSNGSRSSSNPNSTPNQTPRRMPLHKKVGSPDVALADMTDGEELSPSSSRDDESYGQSKPKFDSGTVLDLVREVVRGRNESNADSPPTKSPVSVMDGLSTPVQTPERTGKSPETSPEDGSPFLSSRLIALRTELIEVRSQLTEANAARIKAESRCVEVEGINDEIQRETKKLREEVSELKQLVMNLKLRENQNEIKYCKKVDEIEQELKATKEKAEKEAKAVVRLEEELTETQNEADELRGQVARFMKELDRTKKESEEKVRVSESEAKMLQEELRLMKEKLSQTNSEIVKQAAEHLKKRQEIEAELEQTRETSSALRRRVLFMDDQLSRAESESEHLKSRLQDGGKHTKGNFSLSPQSGSWKKSLTGFAESISRTMSDGGGDAPIIISDAPPKDSRSSVIERLRQTLEPKADQKAGGGLK